METNNSNAEIQESEKLVDENSVVTQNNLENNSASEITLEQFKSALENNLECKGFFDSLCDKTVNTRLDKGIESWKEKNLNNLIEEEINKRYPQKTEAEVKFEEQQKELEKAMEEKRQLELQIKYQSLMAENNLPLDILDFVAGKDIETTISNIGKFKSITDTYVAKKVQYEINERFKRNSYIPPSSNGDFVSCNGSMWEV